MSIKSYATEGFLTEGHFTFEEMLPYIYIYHIHGLVQGCGISIVNP